jgi:hypothetical protein
MNMDEDTNDKLQREELYRHVTDVREALDEAMSTDLAVGLVFDFFILNKVARRELIASPSRHCALMLIEVIRVIRSICAAGKQKFPDMPLEEETLIEQIGLLVVYMVLGVTFVKEVLNETECDRFRTFMVNYLIPPPELEPFTVA